MGLLKGGWSIRKAFLESISVFLVWKCGWVLFQICFEFNLWQFWLHEGNLLRSYYDTQDVFSVVMQTSRWRRMHALWSTDSKLSVEWYFSCLNFQELYASVLSLLHNTLHTWQLMDEISDFIFSVWFSDRHVPLSSGISGQIILTQTIWTWSDYMVCLSALTKLWSKCRLAVVWDIKRASNFKQMLREQEIKEPY